MGNEGGEYLPVQVQGCSWFCASSVTVQILKESNRTWRTSSRSPPWQSGATLSAATKGSPRWGTCLSKCTCLVSEALLLPVVELLSATASAHLRSQSPALACGQTKVFCISRAEKSEKEARIEFGRHQE